MNKILGWVLIIVIIIISGFSIINSFLINTLSSNNPSEKVGILLGTILFIYLISLLVKYIYKKNKIKILEDLKPPKDWRFYLKWFSIGLIVASFYVLIKNYG